MLFYGILFLLLSGEGKDTEAISAAHSYLAYMDELKYERIALDYPELSNRISKLSEPEEAIRSRKFDIFGKKKEKIIRELDIQLDPKPKIILPKILSAVPLTVEEMNLLCNKLAIERPIYYQQNEEPDSFEPARFIPGQLAYKLALATGFTLPEKKDVSILPHFIKTLNNNSNFGNPCIPKEDDWEVVVDKLLEWADLKKEKIPYIEKILWTVSLTLEDRYRILCNLKSAKAEKGWAGLPRALFYRLSGTQLDKAFAQSNIAYLKTQWRIAKSLLAMAKIEQLPPISACWGVDSLIHAESLKHMFLLPIMTECEMDIEVVCPEMGFADCVLLRSGIIDDFLYKDKGGHHV